MLKKPVIHEISKSVQADDVDYSDLNTATEILHRAGFAQALSAMTDYLNRRAYPLLSGKDRDKWLADRMRKVRDRYFEDLDPIDLSELRKSFSQLWNDEMNKK